MKCVPLLALVSTSAKEEWTIMLPAGGPKQVFSTYKPHVHHCNLVIKPSSSISPFGVNCLSERGKGKKKKTQGETTEGSKGQKGGKREKRSESFTMTNGGAGLPSALGRNLGRLTSTGNGVALIKTSHRKQTHTCSYTHARTHYLSVYLSP